MHIFKSAMLLLLSLSLTGCVTPMKPKSEDVCHEDSNQVDINGCHYFSQTTPYLRTISAINGHPFPPYHAQGFDPRHAKLPIIITKDNIHHFNRPLALSVGDKIDIHILNGDDFSRAVEVDADGNIYLPYLPAIKASNLTLEQLNQRIKHTLIELNMMHEHAIRISIVPISWAAINIISSGAIFEPGQHMINKKKPVENIDDGSNYSGDQASDRSITTAIKSSGGIRPDADITRVTVTRNDYVYQLDLTSIFTGRELQQFTLMSGDRVHVPTTHTFNDDLVRPSQITPPGIRVFMSNLTQPASSNSQSAVDREATRFPYGTRLLNGAIAANCVGGAQSTNASRYVILVTKNPLSSKIDVVERAIDDLIRQAWKPNMNPVLLPGDGIACYDSRVTNAREIVRSITEVVIPSSLMGYF
ncbi:polysaccharide biosynthesis/export family protein [Shewanella intestini]|uniref:Polysaccharide export protein n=1 Tax=Shewanella intestini TaxID=2017544 RepID=A0ABS5HYN0_9GAMM|nr:MULTISPECIES: polysaccharide biosynthesis/export family protein [Shewanella]MBR9726822.1 polysaccharide export protein [Shewanella intestini]MRG34612.1 polysaccharide export protein [Shewanella sp. XMDDZSB0408]